MVTDSITSASIPMPASNTKDFAKKKRANRSAKLKQCKLDVVVRVASLLNKMQLHVEKSVSGYKECTFDVSVPPTGSDILHPCGVAEDVAIVYVYNEIPKRKPSSLKPLPLK